MIVAVVAWLIASAEPDIGLTQSLYQQCKSPATAVQSMCITYVQGMMDMMEALTVATRQFPQKPIGNKDVRQIFGICRNVVVSGAQLRQMFINWADAHPDAWQTPRTLSVWSLLQSKWPCSD